MIHYNNMSFSKHGYEYFPRPRKVRQQKQTELKKLMFLKITKVNATTTTTTCATSITIPYFYNYCPEDLKVFKYDETYDWLKIDNDILVLCPIDSDRVKIHVFIIENVMRSMNIKFRMEYDSAYWSCQKDEFVFILRLWWDEDDMLVLEPTCFVGDKLKFQEFYNNHFIANWI